MTVGEFLERVQQHFGDIDPEVEIGVLMSDGNCCGVVDVFCVGKADLEDCGDADAPPKLGQPVVRTDF